MWGMKMKITSEFTAPILNQLMTFIDCNINITDEHGIIVASCDRNRINQIHKGAVQVLALKRELIISADQSELLYSSKPEINLPIEFLNHFIGVIGIDVIGDINFKYKLARVIKMNLEVLLNQMHMHNQLQFQQKAMEAWIADLINPNEFDAKKLESVAQSININFEMERSVFLIRIEEFILSHEQLNNPYELHKVNELREKVINKIRLLVDSRSIYSFTREFIFLAIPFNAKNNQSEKNQAELFKTNLEQLGIHLSIGIGDRYKGIEGYRESYSQAKQCITLLHKLENNKGIAHIEDWGLERLMDSIPEKIRNIFFNRYSPFNNLLSDELEHTLEVFLECDLNVKEAALKLHLHRNTLIYRLEKLSEQLKLDPKKFNDAVVYKLLLINKKLND
jgi:carbohydrate diacid regulator